MTLVNTDLINALGETTILNATFNQNEIDLIQSLVLQLNNQGLSCNDIGIITPLRAQIKHMHEQYALLFPGLEVDSVDRFQGRDKDCIIMSFVKSNDFGNVEFTFPLYSLSRPSCLNCAHLISPSE